MSSDGVLSVEPGILPVVGGARPALIQGAPLADQVAAHLTSEIVAGRRSPESALPPEARLAAEMGVSRLTIREAVKVLAQKGLVRVERGRGTYVNAPARWSPLDPLLLAARAARSGERRAALGDLLEARRLVEPGVAELAAQRRDDDDVHALRDGLARMREADDDVERFVAADIAFHDRLLGAAANPVAAALFEPVSELLRAARRATSLEPGARAHAVAAHERILTAVEARDGEGARREMLAHLLETEADVTAEPGPGAGAAEA